VQRRFYERILRTGMCSVSVNSSGAPFLGPCCPKLFPVKVLAHAGVYGKVPFLPPELVVVVDVVLHDPILSQYLNKELYKSVERRLIYVRQPAPCRRGPIPIGMT